ncbi:MAG: hypothetical protein HYY92_00660 [Parcubacteria group bacterium]|nr:hypothetical protein [Parcubacteria group bacterium]
MRHLTFIFLAGFLMNFLWENLHAPLYIHYQGGAITEIVLFHAALFDAAVITLFAAFAFLVLPRHFRQWFMLIAGILFAIGLEIFALKTGRWEYAALMPLIPFINVGLSPALQLGLTGWLALFLTNRYGTPRA